MFSDGLDTTQGLNLASITQSFDLDRASLKAQRKGVAIYSVYAPTALTESSAGSSLGFAAQGALAKFSDETGGRAFFSGTQAPISLLPFFRDMVISGRESRSGTGALEPSRIAKVPLAYPVRSMDWAKMVQAS